MNPLVAAFIAAMSCSEPALNFRDFYTKFYTYGVSDRWQGSNYETMQSVFIRQSNASADFLEYRIARAEKCR